MHREDLRKQRLTGEGGPPPEPPQDDEADVDDITDEDSDPMTGESPSG